MSIQVAKETDSLLGPPKKPRCCIPKYRPRKITSKGAKLVLMWNFLVITVAFKPESAYRHKTPVVAIVLLLVWLASAVISGYLADSKLGRYSMVSAGLTVTWVGSIITATNVLLQSSIEHINHYITTSLLYAGIVVTFLGVATFQVNIVQFGMEQMYDASSEEITAFISWFAITLIAGVWMSDLIRGIFASCLPTLASLPNGIDIALLSIALCSNFLLKCWLIDHKKTYKPLKTVYQVLKYAKQHKYPVNRSAFTYWEEEIPSRIDLGKTKYGGPFTTEQVEDVKTFLRVALVMVGIILSFFASAIVAFGFRLSYSNLKGVTAKKDGNRCTDRIIFVFSHGSVFVTMITFIAYELIVYPICKKWIPSMLKRIGICIAFNIALSIAVLVIVALMETTTVNIPDNPYLNTSLVVPYSLYIYIFSTGTIEFIVAQSPENMKGLIFACTWFSVLLLFAVVALVDIFWTRMCIFTGCWITLSASNVVFMTITFILYFFVARWYKRRERDEPCNERAIIEDIYSRRVEQNNTEMFY